MRGSRNRGTASRLKRPRRRAIALGGIVGVLAVASLLSPISASVVASPDVAKAADACPWMDTSLTADQRARALLDVSTLDQKLRWLDEQSANNPTQTTFSIGGGQNVTMPLPPACTPVIQYTDGPAAVSGAGTGVTAFTGQTTLSSTWDRDLARRKGKAHGYEAFHKHRNVVLG